MCTKSKFQITLLAFKLENIMPKYPLLLLDTPTVFETIDKEFHINFLNIL